MNKEYKRNAGDFPTYYLSFRLQLLPSEVYPHFMRLLQARRSPPAPLAARRPRRGRRRPAPPRPPPRRRAALPASATSGRARLQALERTPHEYLGETQYQAYAAEFLRPAQPVDAGFSDRL